MESQQTINNSPINTALCSIGMSGIVFHAPFIEVNPDFRLTAILERTKNITIEKYPHAKQYRELDKMLADEDIELVIVNTPNVTHYEYAKKALLAGKHVIIEKPFTPTIEQGLELIELSKRQNKILSVYHNRRYDSDFLTIQKVIKDHLIGEIREAEFHYDRFDENLSYKSHKEKKEKGTGCLYDLGSHLIDQALTLFGMPEYVFADIFIMRPISEVDDYFELLLYYTDFRVRLKASYQVREALPGFILHGNKGSFIKNKADVQEKNLMLGLLPDTIEWGKESIESFGLLHTELDGSIVRQSIESLRGDYMNYYNLMYKSIRLGSPLPVSAEEGLNVIRIIEAAFKSNEEKRAIKLI